MLPRDRSRRAWIVALACAVLASLSPIDAMATEEAPFTLVEKQGDFELRRYAPYVVAETLVEGSSFEKAGNVAFKRLFGYISGDNAGSRKISMTAPVTQDSAPQKIAMTAPVSQVQEGSAWRVAFVLPSSLTLDTAPVPNDARVKLVQMPARTEAVVRYSGTWSKSRYDEQLARLQGFIKEKGLVAEGEPVFARYDPPFMPWFLRRNEILLTVRAPDGG